MSSEDQSSTESESVNTTEHSLPRKSRSARQKKRWKIIICLFCCCLYADKDGRHIERTVTTFM